MSESTLLDSLVKFASFGASGVCVLGVGLIGWLLYRLPRPVDPQQAGLLRSYMRTCIAIAVISAVSGALNAYFNADKIQTLEGEKGQLSGNLLAANTKHEALAKDVKQKDDQIAKLESSVQLKDAALKSEAAKDKELKRHLDIVLRAKGVAADSTGADETVKASIKSLQEMIRQP